MEIRNPFLPKELEEYGLAEKLRDLRAYRGFTQKQVAEIAGIDESTVRNYELARRVPKAEHIAGLARALEVMPESLILFDPYIGLNEGLRMIWEFVDVYGFRIGYTDEFAYLAPGRTFFTVAMKRWCYAYTEMKKNEREFRQNYELWKDEFHDHFEKSDYPKIYPAFDPIDPSASQRFIQGEFAYALKAEREFKSLTQSQLAEQSGISMFTLRSYEQGKRLPRKGQLDALRNALDLNDAALTGHYLGSPNQAMHYLFALSDSLAMIPNEIEDLGPILVACNTGIEWGMRNLADEVEAADDGSLSSRRLFTHWLNVFDAYGASQKAAVGRDVTASKPSKAFNSDLHAEATAGFMKEV